MATKRKAAAAKPGGKRVVWPFTAAAGAIKLARFPWQGLSRWYSSATLQAAMHFVSGVNNSGEVSGLANGGVNIGITCGEIRTGLLATLELYAGWFNQLLFVDSGAFSEVDFPEDGPPIVVRPLTDADWRERLFDVYRWAARTYGRNALVVGPDCVGNQAETLARLERYAAAMRQIARAATVILPVQKGALPMAEMFELSCELLAADRAHVVAGIPMAKDATSLADIETFARSLPADARVHLLGIGPKARGNRYALAIAALRRGCPTVRISSDSAVMVSLVGRGGKNAKPGTKARPLTALQDVVRAGHWLNPSPPPHAVKDIAISMWLHTLCPTEDRLDARAMAVGRWRAAPPVVEVAVERFARAA